MVASKYGAGHGVVLVGVGPDADSRCDQRNRTTTSHWVNDGRHSRHRARLWRRGLMRSCSRRTLLEGAVGVETTFHPHLRPSCAGLAQAPRPDDRTRAAARSSRGKSTGSSDSRPAARATSGRRAHQTWRYVGGASALALPWRSRSCTPRRWPPLAASPRSAGAARGGLGGGAAGGEVDHGVPPAPSPAKEGCCVVALRSPFPAPSPVPRPPPLVPRP